jgi:hypothetical protein
MTGFFDKKRMIDNQSFYQVDVIKEQLLLDMEHHVILYSLHCQARFV